MNVTLVLAQALGIIFVVMGISMLGNKKYLVNAVQDIMRSPGLLWLCGFVALAMGAVLVALGNLWGSGSQLLIAILGWIAVLKGVFILIFPGFTVSL